MSLWQACLEFCGGDVSRAVQLAVEVERRALRVTRRERLVGRPLIYMFDGRYAVRVSHEAGYDDIPF